MMFVILPCCELSAAGLTVLEPSGPRPLRAWTEYMARELYNKRDLTMPEVDSLLIASFVLRAMRDSQRSAFAQR